ncbi:7TM-DISM domain-containing protein [Oceanicoccus sagamiensis]|uniref:histidine kinase n=1 Tax=Oceanicoccus sagamiensis TaxID=716816 RepID=A0A1X9NGI9_9GAMM|nr:7TM-DISM domain-containing protein [Oceanicoccus sagamiensis]ARN75512.1 hypothetical protein BST96_16190 [Oceanicoccus sagamiensis]
MFALLAALLSFQLVYPEILVDESFDQLFLQEQVRVLETPEALSYEQAIAKLTQGEFKTVAGQGLAYPSGKHYYWLHYRVRNTGSAPITVYTEIRNPHINYLQLFEWVIGDSAVTASKLTGDYTLFDTRPIDHRFYVFPSPLAAGETKEFLLFADKYNESMKLPIMLRSETNFLANSSQENALLGLYIGIYLVIIVCLVILNISRFKGIYFSLLTYVVSFALFAVANTGLGFQYIWREVYLFNSLSRPVLTLFAAVSLLIFCHFYFELGRPQHRKAMLVHRIARVYFSLNWLFFCLYYLLILLQLPLPGIVFIQWVQIGVALLPVYLIAMGVYFLVTDFRWKYAAFLLANVGILSAILIIVLEEMGVVQNVFLQENITMLALVLDFSVLTCVIGGDFYRLRIDNQQLSNSLSEALIEGGQQFVEGQQRERTRLAQELHDGASSRLSALQMRISALTTDDKALKQSLVNETQVIAQDIRRFSHNLSSVVLERYGFINAIEELLYSIEESETGFEVEFNYTEDSVASKSTERELYFMCLELINNAIKYSTGDHLLVEFRVSDTLYELIVSDNGDGYLSDNLSQSGLGLKGINWRLQLLKGEMKVEYRDGYQYHRIKIPRYSPGYI